MERINSIIKENNYIPNMSARSLAGNSSRIIGAILPASSSKRTSFLNDPFNTELLSGIEKSVKENNYYLMVRSIHSYEEIYTLLQNWKVDGIIILGLLEDESEKIIEFSKTPVLFIDTYNEKSNMNIGLIDEEGGYLAAKHLIDNGHTSIGFVSYEIKPHTVMDKRFNGFKKMMEACHVPIESIPIIQVTSDIESTPTLQDELLALAKKCTAICCTADILAIQVMDFLKNVGYDFPTDLSIIGFDNLYISSLVTPKLTTIDQNIFEKGYLASKHLIESIHSKSSEAINIQLPVSLIVRDSVKSL